MWCDDPLVRQFRRLGYNVLRLPTAGFVPLLLLESDGRRRARPVGHARREFRAEGVPLPKVRRNDAAPNITVTRTASLSLRPAARFLDPLLGALGAPSVGAELRRARSLQIVLEDVRRDSIQRGDLARYLESDVEPASDHVLKATQSNQLFVVTSVLRSTTVSILVDRRVAEALRAQAGAPGLPVAIGVGEARQSDDALAVTLKGSDSLTFAFQAVRLVYDAGGYSDYASAHGLTGFAWDTRETPVEGMLSLDDDLNEIDPVD